MHAATVGYARLRSSLEEGEEEGQFSWLLPNHAFYSRPSNVRLHWRLLIFSITSKRCDICSIFVSCWDSFFIRREEAIGCAVTCEWQWIVSICKLLPSNGEPNSIDRGSIRLLQHQITVNSLGRCAFSAAAAFGDIARWTYLLCRAFSSHHLFDSTLTGWKL